MEFTEEQKEEFERIVRPLIKFLNDNCHPHVVVVVDNCHAELSEGVCVFRTEEYWTD